MTGTDEMRELLIRLYDSFNTGDPKIWRDAVAEDALGVGSDPDEWWDGRSVVLRIGEAQVQEMGAAHVHVEPARRRSSSRATSSGPSTALRSRCRAAHRHR
jgi:hypothetical protein